MAGFIGGVALGAAMLNAIDGAVARQEAAHLADWAACNAAVTHAREEALRSALSAALDTIRSKDARIAELEALVEDLEAELEEVSV